MRFQVGLMSCGFIWFCLIFDVVWGMFGSFWLGYKLYNPFIFVGV